MTTIRIQNKHHQGYPAGCTVAYLRVSTHEQAESGAGLAAQRASIQAYADRAGLTVSAWLTDAGVSGSIAPSDRPALGQALELLSRCRTGVLLIAKADRIARKAADLLHLRDLTERQGWTLSAADGSVDWSTPHGRAMTTVLGAFAELERDLIRSRTREALAARRAEGVVLGRPATLDSAVVSRIVAERKAGATWSQISAGLNDDHVPTAHGGRAWWPATVQRVAARAS
jgi:DNA invertase Pin-like site-specific DNA recombinase